MNSLPPSPAYSRTRTLRREGRRFKRRIAALSFAVLPGLVFLGLALVAIMFAALWLAWTCIKHCRGCGLLKPKPVRFFVTPSAPGAVQIPLCTIIPERRSNPIH